MAPKDRGSPLGQVRARAALREAGLDPATPLTLASSVTNDVWLAPGHAVRVSGALTSRLAREAELARHLPPEVGYPPVVAHGSGVGNDWLIVDRVPGTPLAHQWPDLDASARRRAVTGLARRLRALHAVPTPSGLPPVERCPQLLDPTLADPVAPVRAALDQARGIEQVPAGLVADLDDLLTAAAPALGRFDGATLVHGDLTFENLLWHDGALTAVLDLEWSRGGPPDLDLDVLLRVCAHPQLHVAAVHEARTHVSDYRDVPGWLAEDYPELFGHPKLLDRLRAYCIGYDLHELLLHPPRPGDARLPTLHPVNRLRRVVRGESHLDELARAGVLH